MPLISLQSCWTFNVFILIVHLDFLKCKFPIVSSNYFYWLILKIFIVIFQLLIPYLLNGLQCSLTYYFISDLFCRTKVFNLMQQGLSFINFALYFMNMQIFSLLPQRCIFMFSSLKVWLLFLILSFLMLLEFIGGITWSIIFLLDIVRAPLC